MSSVKTWDISGTGGGYEEACQKMLWTGIKYLSKVDQPEQILKGRSEYKHIYGIVELPESFDECKEEMYKAVNNDCTGAMMQAVTGHLKFIATNGFKKWHEELKTGRKDEQALDFDLDSMRLVTERRQSHD